MSERNTDSSKPSNYANQQVRLVLLAGLPASILALVALGFTEASFYLIAFVGIILALIIGFAAISGRQKADYQIQTLSSLIEAMIDGDYSLRGRKQSNPAFQHLLNRINQLADTLQQHKLKAEESQQLFNMVIQQMDALVIATNQKNQLVILNESAKKLVPHDQWQRLTLHDLSLDDLTDTNKDVIRIEHDVMGGEYIVYRDHFISDNQQHRLFLLTKAEALLRRKEREDWQRLIRVLSHELNNSLTPIASYTQTMLRKVKREQGVHNTEQFIQGLTMVKTRTEALSQFIASYSQLSHLPAAKPIATIWYDKVESLIRLFNDSQFELSVATGVKELAVELDPNLFEQLMINLIKNARESLSENDDKTIEISARIDQQQFVLSIADRGQGIANPDNLFVPFYSTKPQGSGIGLTLCRQIMTAHGGTISLANRKQTRGAVATLVFPLKQTTD